ncbi:MAG: STT3 domain-containing protein [Thermodesulforhabdaceae bacterium]
MKRKKTATRSLQQASTTAGFSVRSILFDNTRTTHWVVALIISLSLCLFFFFYHLKDWYDARSVCFHDGKPTMATYDAYYFMRLTDSYLQGNYGHYDSLRDAPTPAPIPLLVRIAALIQRISGASLEYIGWLLPPFLASLTVLIYGYWARFLKSPFLFVLSSIVGSTAYVWFWRTSLGRFDTDSLNLFFPGALTASIFLILTGDKTARKLTGLAGLALSIVFWYLWWPQGHNVGLLLALGTYGISVFFVPGKKWENILRGIILSGGILLAALIALNVLTKSFPLPDFLKPFAEHLSLALKSATGQEPAVGESITELKVVGWRDGMAQILGHWALAFPAVAGTVLTIIYRPFFFILWVPFLILGIGGFFSNRFLIFLVPPLASGLVFLTSVWLINSKRLSLIPEVWRIVTAILLSIAMTIPNVYINLKGVAIPNVRADLVQMAKTLEPLEPQNSVIWAWWDYGYLLQYYAKKKTFIDGGKQAAPRIIISAYPFATEDVVLAKNWINCFAKNDLHPFSVAVQELGSEAKAFQFLKEALRGMAVLYDALLRHNQEHNEKLWRELLYPKTMSFLYIPVDFLRKTYWWYYYGSWDYDRGQGVHPVSVHFPQWFVNVNPSKGYLTTLDGKKILFRKYVVARNGEFPREKTVAQDPPTVLFMTVPGVAIILSEDVSESTALKLYRHPDGFGNAFDLIYYNPAYGGIWRTNSTDD